MSEDDLLDILDNVPSLIQCVSTEGRLLYANKAWRQTLGYDRQEILGLTMSDFIASGSLEHCHSIFCRLLRGETPGPVHANFLTRDGVVLAVEGKLECIFREGAPHHTLGYFKILDHEARLSRLQERFFTVSLDLLCVADFDGYFRLLNPVWESVLGFSVKELVNRPFIELVHPDDREVTLSQARALARGEATVHFENRYLHKDGSYRWVSWVAASDVDSRLILASAHDVTEKRAQEKKLRAARKEAEAARREAEAASIAKSSFLANMSHELRTPLNSVIGFSELLTDEAFGALNSKQSRYVDNILSNGRQLLNLINDILDLSKVEAGEMTFQIEVVNLKHLLLSALDQMKPLAEKKNQDIGCEFEDVDYLAFADLQRTRQIFLNLLSNAIKFTPQGGRVQVAITPDHGEWRVSIKDNGRGLRPEHVDAIFERFKQVDGGLTKAEPGTGLGLALTQEFVQQQSGRIWAESEGEGLGSTFYFTLGMAESAPLETPVSDGLGHKPLILIVEDNREAGKLLMTHLASAGYRTARAVTGKRALELARTLEPDAITLDLHLHDMDGWEVLRSLKADPLTRAIPIIISSVDGDSLTGEASKQAAAFLAKPVSRDEFLKALQKWIPAGKCCRVLLIDDDPSTLELFGDWLSSQGLEIHEARGGEEGLKIANTVSPDAIVIDLNMAGIDGFETIDRLRASAKTAELPVIVFTADSISPGQSKRLASKIQGLVSKAEKDKLLSVLQQAIERENADE